MKFEYPLIIRGLCVSFQTIPKKSETEKVYKKEM